MIGQQVMLCPISNELNITLFRDTVSIIDNIENALMMVDNSSEDIWKIPNGAQVATIMNVTTREVYGLMKPSMVS